jgi:hypothetical protein
MCLVLCAAINMCPIYVCLGSDISLSKSYDDGWQQDILPPVGHDFELMIMS